MATGTPADTNGSELTFQLFGGLRAERLGESLDLGGRKQRAVLAALLVDAGRVVSVDQLVDRVWNDTAPDQATASLQAYVSNLRRLLDPDRPPGQPSDVIMTQPGGYLIRIDRQQLDIAIFEDLHREGLRSLGDDDPSTAAASLDAARALFGPVLPDLADHRWVADLQTRLDAVRAEVLEGAFEAKLELNQERGMLAEVEAAVLAYPFRERLRCQLALALYRMGRQTEALRCLADARRTLTDEVGVDPGPELRQLEADILAQAPTLTTVEDTSPSPSGAKLLAPPGHGRNVDIVGRTSELETLIEATTLAAAGTGGAAVISGEPGIGKTRLAEELASYVTSSTTSTDRDAGMLVAWTRCPESAATAPGWTCIQLLGQVTAAGALDADAVDNATAQATSTHLSQDVLDPGAERFEFHTAATAALKTTERPLLLVIDDLQWADPSSLRLLEFIAGELRTMPVLLLATVRPLGPEPSAALVACLGELARHSSVRRLDLQGLDPADVELWLNRRSAGTVDPRVAQLVHTRTNGNPFFVGEVVELLETRDGFADVSKARELGVPAAVHDVVRRRVDLLPEETRKLLTTAAVLGGNIDVDLLAHVAAQSVPAAVEALDPAVDAGLLVEDRQSPGQLRFAHALVADAVAAELTVSRRARLHAATVEALEDLRPANLDQHLAELLYHATEGVLAGTATQALDYATRAARLAADRRQYEDAAAYWFQALRMTELAQPGDRQARLEILIELGDSRRHIDDVAGCHEVSLEAINLANDLDDPGAAVRAATLLSSGSLWQPGTYGKSSPETVTALRGVLVTLDDTPTTERVEILGGLADVTYYSDMKQADAWSRQAVDEARQVGDTVTLAGALHRRYLALQRPSARSDRLAAAEEIVALNEDPGLPAELACVGYYGRAGISYERGDPVALEADLARGHKLAADAGSPGLLAQIGWFDISWALAQGDYDKARSMADDTYALHRRSRRADAYSVMAVYMTIAGHDRGDLHNDQQELFEGISDEFDVAIRELGTMMLAEIGQLDAARQLAGTPGTSPELPEDWLWLALTTVAAYGRAALTDVEACRTLHDRLLPYSGSIAVAGPGGPCMGSVDLALARVKAVLGDETEARRLVGAAVEQFDRMGTLPWLARALLTQHDLLARSDDADDRATAAAALARCRTIATDIGLARYILRDM